MVSTRKVLSEENINKIIENINITDFLNNKIGDKIYNALEEAGIPKVYVSDTLNNENVKEYATNYIKDLSDSLLNDKPLPTINNNEVANILKTSFIKTVDNVNSNTENIDTTYTEKIHITKEKEDAVLSKIDEVTPKIVEAIPTFQDIIKNKLDENNNYLNAFKRLDNFQCLIQKVRKIYSFQNFLLILIFIFTGIIIGIEFKKAQFLKFLLIPPSIVGLRISLIVFISKGLTFKILDQINSIYFPISILRQGFSIVFNNLMMCVSICLLIVLILLMILGVIKIVKRVKKIKND